MTTGSGGSGSNGSPIRADRYRSAQRSQSTPTPVIVNDAGAAPQSLHGTPVTVDNLTSPAGRGAVRSVAAWCLAEVGKSSLPSSRMVMLLNSMGQNGKSGRSLRVA
jgi:hypothetical protein